MRLFLTFKTISSSAWTLNVILLNNGRFLTEELTLIRRAVTYGFVNDGIIDTDFLFVEL